MTDPIAYYEPTISVGRRILCPLDEEHGLLPPNKEGWLAHFRYVHEMTTDTPATTEVWEVDLDGVRAIGDSEYPSYTCLLCGAILTDSGELAQHLMVSHGCGT